MGNKQSRINPNPSVPNPSFSNPSVPNPSVPNPLGYNSQCISITPQKKDYYIHTYDPRQMIELLKGNNIDENVLQRFDTTIRRQCCNVISLSLYFVGCLPTNMLKYLLSIERTVKNVRNNLPLWIVRIYFDESVHDCMRRAIKGSLEKKTYDNILASKNVEAFTYLCGDVQDQNIERKRTYRFLPFSEEDVNICIVREADGTVSNWDCRQIDLFSKDPTKIFYLPYNQMTRSSMIMFESYERWLLIYKVIFRYDFFYNNYMGYDLLAGLFGIKLKLTRDYYIRTIVSLRREIDSFTSKVIEKNDEAYNGRGDTKYFLAGNQLTNIRSLFKEDDSKPSPLSVGFDEILLLEMFKEFFSFTVKNADRVILIDGHNIGDVCISEENVKDYDILKTQIHNIVLDESTFDKKIVIDLNGTRAETIDSTCSQLIDAKIIRYHKNPVEKLNLCLNFIDKLLYFIDGQLLDKGNLTDVTDTFSITLKYTKERLIKLPHHLLNLPYESVFDKYYPITESRTGGGGYDKTNINRRNQRNIRQYKSKNKIRRTKKNKTHRRYRGT